MSKHTPGPWTCKGDGKVIFPSGELGVSVWFPREMPNPEHRNAGESWADAYDRQEPERRSIKFEMEANARLIAAAPELLELLSRYVRQDRILGMTANNLYREACETLFKATGEQQ